MKIYIAGISGTGMGALALLAKNLGMEVSGSDLKAGDVYQELIDAGIEVKIGPQNGEFLKHKIETEDVDWFVYTSALPQNHAELLLAQKSGLKISKRDELIQKLIEISGTKLVAVAGTHGKTTTTAMLIWASQKLGLPIGYLVGTTLPFAKSGSYEENARFFIYEADEYDRNFLHFHPWLSIITSISYDHPDIYKTEADYKRAFEQFESQSERVLYGGEIDERITLVGELRRKDATMVLRAIKIMAPEINENHIIEILNQFPGATRRFEKLADGVYTDYAHHPEEIQATLEMAQAEAKKEGKRGVVAIYEPHQNTRQWQIKDAYLHAFDAAEKIYWLPTFLTREDKKLAILKPEDFRNFVSDKEKVEVADLNDDLAQKIQKARQKNYLVLLMTAGPADQWLRGNVK